MFEQFDRQATRTSRPVKTQRIIKQKQQQRKQNKQFHIRMPKAATARQSHTPSIDKSAFSQKAKKGEIRRIKDYSNFRQSESAHLICVSNLSGFFRSLSLSVRHHSDWISDDKTKWIWFRSSYSLSLHIEKFILFVVSNIDRITLWRSRKNVYVFKWHRIETNGPKETVRKLHAK